MISPTKLSCEENNAIPTFSEDNSSQTNFPRSALLAGLICLRVTPIRGARARCFPGLYRAVMNS
jgi:hypothetical protein